MTALMPTRPNDSSAPGRILLYITAGRIDMCSKGWIIVICALIAGRITPAAAQRGGATATSSVTTTDDPIKIMVDRLELEKYKATIRGLTQFGDRRQGTE